jgi:hypothetical protein
MSSPIEHFFPSKFPSFFVNILGKNMRTLFRIRFFWQASGRSAVFSKKVCFPIREKRCCEGYWSLFLALAGWFFSFAFAAEATIYDVVVPLLAVEGQRLFSVVSRGYLERNFQERTIPIADSIIANPVTTAKSSHRLFMPVAPINTCLIPSTA